MGQDPIALIIGTLGSLYIFVLVLRFLLQLSGADYYNPICQSVVSITRYPLAPLQKLIPRSRSLDLSPLVLAVVLKGALLYVLVSMMGQEIPLANLAIFALAGVVDSILNIYFWAVIGAVIISWVAPGNSHPAPQLLMQLTEPLFRLAGKVIPPLGGLDLSPILIFLAIQLIRAQLAPFVVM